MSGKMEKVIEIMKKRSYKFFVSIPKDIIRKKWLEIARWSDVPTVSLTSSLFCCEDHFNVNNI